MSKKKEGTQMNRVPEETRQGQATNRAPDTGYHNVRGNSKRKSHIRNDSAMSLLNRAADAVNLDDIPVGDPANLLALMIIARAVADWKKVGQRTHFKEYGLLIFRNELERFFNSRWCGTLLECAEVTPEELMEAVGVPIRRR